MQAVVRFNPLLDLLVRRDFACHTHAYGTNTYRALPPLDLSFL
jgi:hypothetical protein